MQTISAHFAAVIEKFGDERKDYTIEYRRFVASGIYPFTYDGKIWRPDARPSAKNITLHNKHSSMLSLLNATADYFNGKLPKTTLFISLSQEGNGSNVPLPYCSISASVLSPSNFIIPDWEYQEWDEIKKIAKEKIDVKARKKAVIFFRGDDNSSRTHEIRSMMERITEGNPLFDIKVSRVEQVPFYEWSKFSYLLDLPGETAASTRELKKLFLCDSVIIHVSLLKKERSGGVSSPQMQFLDFFIQANKDYINVNTAAIYDEGKKTEEDVEYNFHQFTKLADKLERIGGVNPRRFNEMKSSGYRTVNAITNETVYRYIRKLMYMNNRLVVPLSVA